MTLKQIEHQISDIRQQQGVSFQLLQERGLYPASVYHIERGENYSFLTILKYLQLLNSHLAVNGSSVDDIVSLGAMLHDERVRQGYSLVSLGKSAQISARTIINIEKGRGYTKMNIHKYLSKVKVDLSIQFLL